MAAVLSCVAVVTGFLPFAAGTQTASAADVSDVDRFVTFDGIRQWAQATSTSFDIVDDFSFSAWVRPADSCSSGPCNVVIKNVAYSVFATNGTWQYRFGNGSSWTDVDTRVAVRANEWVHLALTRVRSTGRATFYVNGESMQTSTYSAAFGTTTKILGIGAFADNSTRSTSVSDFTGDIDDVRLWSVVRTQAQIQTDMNTWGPTTTSGLVGYWDFNESSNTVARNMSSSATAGTDLTLVNLPARPDVKTVSTSGSNTVVSFPRSYLTAAGGWRAPPGVSAVSYLAVAGGGGGGAHVGGGGGGGGVLTGTGSVQPGDVVGVTVGTGGIGGLLHTCPNGNPCVSDNGATGRQAANGTNSVVDLLATTVTAVGGGSGGHWNYHEARSGGSGGGSGYTTSAVAAGTAGQGSNGGSGFSDSLFGGGGGGAGGVGTTATATQVGNGGPGVSSSITGTLLFYGGGGGGAIHSTNATYNPGTGGSSVGGAGSEQSTAKAGSGVIGRGGGGGGAGNSNNARSEGGDGGSGVVVLSYASANNTCETEQTVQGAHTVVAFKEIGTCTWSVPSGVTAVDYLVVAGGGGGASRAGGGGGAGGYLAATDRSVSGVSTLTVTVGAGGIGANTNQSSGNSGSNSVLVGGGSFSTVTAIGGGFGARAGATTGGDGGSGGGAGGSGTTAGSSTPVGLGTSGQGNNGGQGRNGNSSPVSGCAGSTTYWCAGGGGGAGAGGGNAASGGAAGSGGVGLAPSWLTSTTAQRLSIGEVSGSSVFFAGGGGGGSERLGTAGAGGLGGGGRGSNSDDAAAFDGRPATGGGGGGSGYRENVSPGQPGQMEAGDGGSGVVVLRYTTASLTTSASVDSAAVLNGSSQYYQVSEGTAFVSRATYTVESWIYPTSTTCTATCPFASHDGDYVLSILNGRIRATIFHTSTSQWLDWTTKAYASANEWQHVALVRDGSTARLYVNGDLMDTTTSLGSGRSTYSGIELKIGWLYNNDFFSGRIDQWRLWSTAQTETQIRTAMHEHTPSTSTGLVAQYDFNGVTGTTVANSAPSAAANTALTAVNSPTYVDVKTLSNNGNDAVISFPRSYLTAGGGWTVPNDARAVSVLAVGGGGGGGTDAGGGGGGGGMRFDNNVAVTAGTAVSVRVGQGGRAGSWGGGVGAGWSTTSGQSSTIAWGSRTYTGGGGGGGDAWSPPNTPQGGAAGTSSGNGSGSNGGRGGNGPRSVCSEPLVQGDIGSSGQTSAITGSTTNYGGGGGGGVMVQWNSTTSVSATGRAGGAGGGGRGADWNLSTRKATTGFSGTDGLGGGGGGSHACGDSTNHDRLSGHRTDGGYGGSGIVIVSYSPVEVCAPVTTRYGIYRVYEFKPATTCEWNVPTGVTSLDYLVVAGGGGGGASQGVSNGGGGGAGGVLNATGLTVTADQALSLTVGAGGTGGVVTVDDTGTHGTRGGNSSLSGSGLSTLTAQGGGYGGGAGGSTSSDFAGGNGGSGGGALGSAVTAAAGGSGTANQGTAGGSNNSGCGNPRPSGGGGGASAAGGSGSCTGSQSGHGGAGRAVSITGASVTYGGGGGGAGNPVWPTTAGNGGIGGGGAGGATRGFDAVDGLGGGGGGAGYDPAGSVEVRGGDGGNGTVVLRHVDRVVSVSAGNNQTAVGTTTLPTNPRVVVRDAAGNGVDGVPVLFTVTAGGGSVGTQTVITSGGGFADTTWTLGGSGAQTLTATLDLAESTPVTFSATATQVTLTYDANGGSGAPSSQTVNAGSTVTVAAAGSITRAGYTFTGWNTAATGLGTARAAASTFAMPTSNVTLFAQWTANNYTVTYNANGGSNAPSAVSAAMDSTVTVAGVGSMTRTGYAFAGWNTLANGSGTARAAGSTFTMGSSNVTLFAQWTANSYTVTYNANGGSNAPSAVSAAMDSTVTVAGVGSMTRTGYAFAGWNTLANGSGTARAAGSTFTMSSDNVILYAQWTYVLVPQTISFSTPSARTYGDGQFAIAATASSGLLVSFTSSDTAVCTVATGTVSSGVTTAMVTLGNAGSCSIAASQAGNAEFEPASSVTRTLVVNKKTLTVSGLVASNKEYDRTDSATVNFSGRSFGSSVVGSDNVTLSFGSAVSTFSNSNVGTNKTVTITGLSLSGTASANYQLPSPVTVVASITAKALTVNGAVAASKEYDGNRSTSVSGTLSLNGVILGDTVTVSGSSATGTFDTSAAGVAKPVEVSGITIAGDDAGNYSVVQPTTTATITPKELTVTGLSGVDKVYDRSRTASFTGTPVLSGVIGTDLVTVSAAGATATFDTRAVGSSKTVTLSGVTIGGAAAANYTVAQPTVTASITAAPLTITGVSAVSRDFNGTRTVSLSDNSAALVGVIDADDVTLAKSGAAATFADANVGTAKPVTVTGYALSGNDAGNYSLSQPSGLTANITAAGAGLTWSTPASITYGTVLSSTQLAAEAAVAGTFAYTPDVGERLPAGQHTLSVTFTPTSSNYAPATTTVTLTVNKKTVTVTASSPMVTYGAGRPTIAPLYNGFVSGEGVAQLTEVPTCTTLYDSTTPVSSSGIATTCSGGVASNYQFSFVDGAVTITKRTVTVTASSPTRAYGDAIGVITPSYSNDFVNGDTSSVVSNMACTTAYTVTSAAGTTHATSCSGGTAANYQFAYVSGSITVDKKTVLVTASSPTVTYGDATPTVTPGYGPFANGDTSSVVSNMVCTTSYVSTTPVSSSGVPTTCSGGTASNYTFTYAPGAVTILRKLLTVSASWHTVTYGDDRPTVTPSYSGFVNSETESVLTTAPTCNTSYTNTTPVADSGVATTCSGAAAANYSVAHVDGAVTITRKSVVVTASSPTVTYGDAVPAVSPSYSGFVNNQTASVLTTAPTCSTTYQVTSSVNVSPARTTSCVGAAAANYSFLYTSGSVTINKKSLTVTASSPSVPFGAPVNTVTVTPLFAGFVNSESDSVVDAVPTCTTAYTSTSPVASAPYTRCSGGTDNNYSFVFVDGAVDIVRATVTVTADNESEVYGTALGQSVTVNGLANSDAVLSVVYTYAGTGQTTYASSTTRPVNVGTYSVTPSAVVLSAGATSNYSFHYTAGTASITRKNIAVTASSPTVIYGDPVPAVTPAYSNDFEYADTSAVVSGTVCGTVYTAISNVGSAPGTSCSGATADNYSFSYVAGAVNVVKKTVVVTASSHNVTYGDSPPSVVPSYSGFVNNQTSAALTTLATCTTAYVATSGVGSVPTSCSGAVAANYSFEYSAGTVAVARKELTVTAPSPSVVYGDPTPTLTPTVTGFVNGQSTSVLAAQPTCSTTYTSVSNAGTTPGVTCGGASAANYSFAYVDGAFAIARAEQSTVTVSTTDASLVWQPGPGFATTTLVGAGGDGDGAFTYAVTSTPTVCSVNGSTLTALTAGVCKVTATRAASVNFNQKVSSEYSYTIDKASQTVTFGALAAKTYGDSSFSVSATASSGLTVSFVGTAGVCSVGAPTLSAGISSATVSIVSAGSCVITASQSGTINYLSATAASGSALSRTFTIAQKNLTIVGATASDKVFDGSDTASGSLASATLDGVAFSDDVSIAPTGFTARFDDANAGSNKTVTFASVTLQGSKAANYTVTQPTARAAISQASAGLSWTTPSAVVFGTTLGSAQLNATAGVEGTVAYSPTAGTRLNAGDHVLSVTFTPTSSNYAVATRTVTLRVNKKPVTVTAEERNSVYGNAFTPGFTTTDLVGSDVAADVVYSYTGTGTTNYPTSTTRPVDRGSYSITPSALSLSVGDIANYEVQYLAGTLTISQAQQGTLALVAASGNLTYSPAPSPATTTLSMPVGSTGSGTGAVTYAVVTGSTVCSVSGTTVTALTAGECTVAVTRAADLNFEAKTSQAITITIARATQQVTFGSIENTTYGVGSFAVSPTATSGLTVVVSSSDTSVCDVPTPLTVRIVSVGTCTLVAEQTGNINYLPATAASGSNLVRSFTVSAKTLTLAGVTTVSRNYDGSRDASAQLRFGAAQLGGVVGADVVSLVSVNATGLFGTKTVGVNKPVTVGGLSLSGSHSHRYTLTAPIDVVGTITRAPLTVVGATVVPRLYNGSDVATVDTSAAGFSGVVAGDAVTFVATGVQGRFNDAAAAENKSVTVSGIVAAGDDGANYSVPDFTVTSSILVRPLTVSGITAASREYDGLLGATSILNVSQAQLNGVVLGDSIALNTGNAAGAFTTRTAGANKTITVTGVTISGPQVSNYTLMPITVTGAISQKPLTVTGVAADNHIYDGTTDATSVVDLSQAALVGIVSPDTVTISSGSMQAQFATPTVGTSKTVTISGLTLSGTHAMNYSVVQPSTTADIEQREVSVTGFSVASREYNGTAAATSLVDVRGARLTNTISGDNVAVSTGAVTASFLSRTAAVNKVVTLAGFALAGADAPNYRLQQPTAMATIAQKPLTVTGITAADKIDDGTTRAELSTTNAALVGVIGNDSVSLDTAAASGAFDSAQAGTNKIVRVSGLSLRGVDAPNYTVTQPTTRASISNATTPWMEYKAQTTMVVETPTEQVARAMQLPPAPARVTTQSVSRGAATRVTAVRAAKDAAIPVTRAIITVSSTRGTVLARINVRVDPSNPTTSVTVPYAASRVRVAVQFANDLGVSAGVAKGINVAEGNTFAWGTVAGVPQVRGTEVPGSLVFARGSSALTPSMKTTLNRMAKAAKARGGLVYVTGFAQQGELRSAWLLDTLARKRAEVVAKYLSTVGVRQWITFQGHSGVGSPWNTTRERRVAVSTELFAG